MRHQGEPGRTGHFRLPVTMRGFGAMGLVVLVACGGIVERGEPDGAVPSSPTPVPGLPMIDVEGDDQDLCALRADGAVFCVDSTVDVGEAVPSRVADLPSVVSISVVYRRGCAVTEGGEVWCWGDTGEDRSQKMAPARVPLPKPARKVARGGNHTCALTGDGEVLCWGSNARGQLGSASAGKESKTPVAVDLGGLRAKDVGSGDDFSCASTEDGYVRCWGEHGSGELGIGRREGSPSGPVVVHDVRNVALLRVRSSTACAVETGGRFLCWGVEVSGKETDGIAGLAYEPHVIGGYVPVRLAVGSRDVCGIDPNERIVCYGGNSPFFGSQPGPPIGRYGSRTATLARGATAIALSDWKVAVVDHDGIVWAWGTKVGVSRPPATPTRVPFPR